ncbi:MAG: FdtA/QdtA family cupin domain-containing protein [Lachnospiraceae bacterium]|nr:FdtA/QdtA family cupin domain-containing protein [Lachnospiraceae bacterium]
MIKELKIENLSSVVDEIKKAFESPELECVFWCVSKSDSDSLDYYESRGFHKVVDVPADILKEHVGRGDLVWFASLRGDQLNIPESVAGCKVVRLQTIATMDSGELSFFEENSDIPFDIKRIYYISKVPEGKKRGFHAHKDLKQLLFCPYGRILLTLENESGREEIELSDPSVGVIIEKPTWREMTWLQKDSVLCVAASEFYNTDDYIRDYDEFKAYLK